MSRTAPSLSLYATRPRADGAPQAACILEALEASQRAVIQPAYEAIERGDTPGYRAPLDPDTEWARLSAPRLPLPKATCQ